MRSVKINGRNNKRKTIKALYGAYLKLLKTGEWETDKITESKTFWRGKKIICPIWGFRTKKKGPAIYIISGIHGEEPAGPHAIAESIKTIIKIGKKKPMVVIPLCNPIGYIKKQRHPNNNLDLSVADSDHFLINSQNIARQKIPSNPTCFSLTKYIITIAKKYPPLISLDFHEDALSTTGYIYSQGTAGAKEKLAKKILEILKNNKIPIKRNSKTRFNEKIINGIVGRQKDGSIDELISAKKIIVNNKIVSGPNGKKVFVIETPATNVLLKKRIKAHKAVIDFLDILTNKI